MIEISADVYDEEGLPGDGAVEERDAASRVEWSGEEPGMAAHPCRSRGSPIAVGARQLRDEAELICRRWQCAKRGAPSWHSKPQVEPEMKRPG
jgi:hypothetical protein